VKILFGVALVFLVACPARAGGPVSLGSLLAEMVDRDAIARFPDPAYTCRQFSSYDRASTTPADPKTWFANGDADQYLRSEQVEELRADGVPGPTRTEWVMAEMDGPGAVVRIWSANPKGTLRVYVDGQPGPVIEAAMSDVLGGKWLVGNPLSEESSRGWNLYLPIPYARHCKITSDARGFYYQVNYRTYAAGTELVSLDAGGVERARAEIERVQGLLTDTGTVSDYVRAPAKVLNPGESAIIEIDRAGPAAIAALQVGLVALDIDQAHRSTVMEMEFDGERTVWVPLGDFFGLGVGTNPLRTWWTGTSRSGNLSCRWVMPYQRTARVMFRNLGKQQVTVTLHYRTRGWSWDDRSMHFHATWRHQYPIHAAGGRGTEDWNYVEIAGKGVYAGDALAVMNPVEGWWGEGDEKIYVDGESFPSHFGTGTEDYYGYAWSSPEPFQHPFHAQPRCDGQAYGNNWGHSTVVRVRSLDAIPFTTGLKFDMEVWHWAECDEAYAATTWFYARPGATTNRLPQPDEAARAIPTPAPLPPPFVREGAIECETMTVLAKSPDLAVVAQDMRGFGKRTWSGESHLWVQGRKIGDFVELAVPAGNGPEGRKPVKVTLYATKSWDYGVVRFTILGGTGSREVDLFSGARGRCVAGEPIDLGVHTPTNGRLVLRAEVVGGNEKSEGTRSFFGLDCVVLTPQP
jgi:hypothetical protein